MPPGTEHTAQLPNRPPVRHLLTRESREPPRLPMAVIAAALRTPHVQGSINRKGPHRVPQRSSDIGIGGFPPVLQPGSPDPVLVLQATVRTGDHLSSSLSGGPFGSGPNRKTPPHVIELEQESFSPTTITKEEEEKVTSLPSQQKGTQHPGSLTRSSFITEGNTTPWLPTRSSFKTKGNYNTKGINRNSSP
ncbi:hypothetical protein Taro_002161 [Colocasia esculenta]|uniref:Uncharacterized protein n=1 Tax=Colocasia esculenta TaxID=4460 RepID=A0A843TIC6_COLES|nr:hypothetical protein [Colocasia esculenta]